MRDHNPAIIPRNHAVEAALTAATHQDLAPFHRILTALAHPYADPDTDTDSPTSPDHPQISPHDDSLAPSHGKMPPQIPIECFVPCRLFNHSKQNPLTQK